MQSLFKKWWGLLIALGALVLWWVSQYNGLINLDEEVKKTWANVEGQYQRRADLIPNLVQTVQWFADQERAVFTEVTEARTKATSINVNIDNPESLEQFVGAQSQVSAGLWRLLAVAENYPDLKSNENFLDLQKQLEWTENRIAVARWAYNEAIKQFSTRVRSFPVNLVASRFWFEPREWFKADEGSSVAPSVEFDTQREE